MVDSQVPEIRLQNGGSIALNVQVAGFTDKNPVEIYGYVTQDTGAYAAFHEAGQLPPHNSEDSVNVKVTLTPEQLKLDTTEPVTVVTWVSEVWPSMLYVDESASNVYGSAAGESKIWKIDKATADSYRYRSRATKTLPPWDETG